MKILCNPNKEDGKRHYRWFIHFQLDNRINDYDCHHCGYNFPFSIYMISINLIKKRLKNHTCPQRLKELKKEV